MGRPDLAMSTSREDADMRGSVIVTFGRPGMLAIGLLLAMATASPALATVSNTYSIVGAEYYATATEGRFAGTGSGSAGDFVTWNARITHTPLTTTAEITGGSATLLTSDLTQVTGRFSGGDVRLTAADPGCGREWYAVTGMLKQVRRSDASGNGSGTFVATLTHYRQSILGQCITYSATVAGTITLQFPGGAATGS
jgi:hypothetical protein